MTSFNMEKKEWFKGEVEELIRSYQTKPALWDIRRKEYKNRAKKKQATEDLALKFDTTPEEIARKIHNLRNQFNTELKKISKAQKNDEEYVSKWPYFMAMTFLQSTMHFRTPEGNIMVSDEIPIYTNEKSNSDEDFKSSTMDIDQPCNSSMSQRHFVKRRHQNSNDFGCFENLDFQRDNSQFKKEDEFDVFSRSIAIQMRQLPLQDALELQAEIQNLVVKKRIQVLNFMRC